jgi:hypothetical protein
MAAGAELPAVEVKVWWPPDAAAAKVQPVSAAPVSVASRLASSPASVANAVERAAVWVSTRQPLASPGTQVATGPVTGKPLALNSRVR